MSTFEILEKEIIKRFKALNPNKIILFGSCARNEKLDENSDIDLYVVTNDEYIPKNFIVDFYEFVRMIYIQVSEILN